MQRPILPVALIVLLLVATALAAGCGRDLTVDLQPEGGDYDPAAVDALLDEVDTGKAAEVLTEDAPEAREEVLIDLRTQGDEGSEVADLLMRGFPEETAALPVLIEGATFGGTDAWVVVEAWGDPGSPLVHRRAWVFDRETGDLLYSASRR